MNWFTRCFRNWASNKHRKELAFFLNGLASSDGSELGFLLAYATHVRHQLEEKGHNILDPFVYLIQNPIFPYTLSSTIIQLQKDKRNQDAAALMVWLHTFRAAANPLELRSLGRQLWGELARGFPYVEEATQSATMHLGINFNIEGYNTFPEGLTPEPL